MYRRIWSARNRLRTTWQFSSKSLIVDNHLVGCSLHTTTATRDLQRTDLKRNSEKIPKDGISKIKKTVSSFDYNAQFDQEKLPSLHCSEFFSEITDYINEHRSQISLANHSKLKFTQIVLCDARNNEAFIDNLSLCLSVVNWDGSKEAYFRRKIGYQLGLIWSNYSFKEQKSLILAYEDYLKTEGLLTAEKLNYLMAFIAFKTWQNDDNCVFMLSELLYLSLDPSPKLKLWQNYVISLITSNLVNKESLKAFIDSFQVSSLDDAYEKKIVNSIEEHLSHTSVNWVQRNKAVAIGAFMNFYRTLEKDPQLAKEVTMNFAIFMCVEKANLLLAVSFCMQLPSHLISKPLLTSLVDSLISINPAYDELEIDALFKLITQCNYKLTSHQGLLLYEKSLNCQTPELPIMSNTVFRLVFSNLTSDGNASFTDDLAFINHSKDLISRNIEKNNPAGVFIIHEKLKTIDPDWYIKFPLITKHILRIFKRHRSYFPVARDLAHKILSHSEWETVIAKNETLLAALFDLFTYQLDFPVIKKLLKHISNPPSRIMLKPLLQFYLKINDKESIRKTLELLSGEASRSVFSAWEFNEIIKTMLRSSSEINYHVYKSIKDRDDLNLTKFSYVAFMDHMVNNSKGEIRLSVAFDCVESIYKCYERGYLKFEQKEQLCFLSMIYLKYIVKNVTLETVKDIYMRSVFSDDNEINKEDVPVIFKTKIELSDENQTPMSKNFFGNVCLEANQQQDFVKYFMKVPFDLSKDQLAKLILYIPNHIKTIALKTIADEARIQGNSLIAKWCLAQFLSNGSSGLEVLIDYSVKYTKFFKSIGIGISELSDDASGQQIREFWIKNGDSFVKRHLNLE